MVQLSDDAVINQPDRDTQRKRNPLSPLQPLRGIHGEHLQTRPIASRRAARCRTPQNERMDVLPSRPEFCTGARPRMALPKRCTG